MNRRIFLKTSAAVLATGHLIAAPVPTHLLPKPVRFASRFAKDLKIGEEFWFGGVLHRCVDHGDYTKEFLRLEAAMSPPVPRSELADSGKVRSWDEWVFF